MFGKFHGSQSYDLERFPTETNTNILFLSACLVESFPIGPERKDKIDFFALFYTTRPFPISYSIRKFDGHPSHWQGK